MGRNWLSLLPWSARRPDADQPARRPTRRVDRHGSASWIVQVTGFANDLNNDFDAVTAGLPLPQFGPVEGDVNRIKMTKR